MGTWAVGHSLLRHFNNFQILTTIFYIAKKTSACKTVNYFISMSYGQLVIAVRDRMFLGVQDFDFAPIYSNLPKSNHFFPNSTSILPKCCHNFVQISPQIQPNVPTSNQFCPQKILLFNNLSTVSNRNLQRKIELEHQRVEWGPLITRTWLK